MARYNFRAGNWLLNPADTIEWSGDTADPWVWSLEAPSGSGAIIAALTPAGLQITPPSGGYVNALAYPTVQGAADAASSGGTIWFPPNPAGYRQTGPLVPWPNQTWLGCGAAGPLTWVATGGFPNLITHTNGSITRAITDCRFTGLKLTNLAGSVAGYGLNLGFTGTPSARVTIDHCEGDHCSLQVWGGASHDVHDNYAHDCHGDAGIAVRASNPGVLFDLVNARVQHNLVVNTDGIGILYQAGLRGIAAENIIENTGLTVAAFAMDYDASRDVVCLGNQIAGCNQGGILFEQSSGTGGVVRILGNQIVGAAASGGTGIQVWPNGAPGAYTDIIIAHNYVSTNKFGIYVHDELEATIEHNILTALGQEGILCDRAAGNMTNVLVRFNRVRGWATTVSSGAALNLATQNARAHYNDLDGTGSLAGARGLANFGANSFAWDNDVVNVTNPAFNLNAGVDLRRNAGIVTESSGSATGTGAQQLVAHGLAFTPTAQQIALMGGSGTANPFHSAAPDATNIKITAANGQTWYWATVGR